MTMDREISQSPYAEPGNATERVNRSICHQNTSCFVFQIGTYELQLKFVLTAWIHTLAPQLG